MSDLKIWFMDSKFWIQKESKIILEYQTTMVRIYANYDNKSRITNDDSGNPRLTLEFNRTFSLPIAGIGLNVEYILD